MSYLNSKTVKGFWENNAAQWIKHIHRDIFKTHVIAPAFLDMLPDVRGNEGLELGCGTGDMTFAVVEKGGRMTGTDISTNFIAHCNNRKWRQNVVSGSIKFETADATYLEDQYESEFFDFAISVHCMMDIEECEKAMQEIGRVVKRGGFFQFSIPHPILWDKQMNWETDEHGNKRSLKIPITSYPEKCKGEVNEWMFQGANTTDKFKTPFFKRSISEWTKFIKSGGFLIEIVEEPRASSELIAQHPEWSGADYFPYGIIFLCRKI